MPPRRKQLSIALLAPMLCQAANPDSSGLESGFSAELSVGGEYNNNLSVDEIDVSSEQGDYALLLGGELEYRAELSEQTEWSLGYNFSQSLYDEFSQLDRQTHILSTDIDVEVGKARLGADYYYVDSRLDGNEFLNQHRISPSVSGFLAREWFLRGAWVYSDTELENNPARDADTHAAEIDVYYFVRGLRSYWNAGYRYKDEDAAAERFTFQSRGVKLRYVRRFDWLQRTCRAEFAWRFEDRDYDGVTASIGEERQDDRHRLRAELQVPFGERGTAEFYYDYSDYESNFPNADYDRQIAGVELRYRW